MRMLKTTLTLLLLAHAPLVPASVVSQTFDLAEVYYDGPVAAPTTYNIAPISLTVQAFDSSLGTLDSVEINWDVTMTGQATNLPDASGSFQFGFNAGFRVGSENYDGFGAGGGTGGPDGATYSDSASATSSAIFLPTDTDASLVAIWATFSGTSAYTLSAYDPDGYFGAYEFQAALANATIELAEGSSVSVIYNYTAVPEPAETAVAVAAGLALLTCLRRRRHA